MVELLIVVAVIGILASISIPKLMQAQRRAQFSAMLAEAAEFSKALLLYNLDNGQYPADDDLDTTTLDPLVGEQYLASNSFVRHLRDGEVHQYRFNPDEDKPLEWHCHPKMVPYDNGAQKIEISGVGTSLVIKYLGETYDTSSILRVIR